MFAKKNCYLFCITVTRVACSQAFLLCPLSSYLRISPLGAAIKGATSFPNRKIAGSHRVLATAVDDWLENLLALAPVQAYAYVQ